MLCWMCGYCVHSSVLVVCGVLVEIALYDMRERKQIATDIDCYESKLLYKLRISHHSLSLLHLSLFSFPLNLQHFVSGEQVMLRAVAVTSKSC